MMLKYAMPNFRSLSGITGPLKTARPKVFTLVFRQ
jgi:hypothetical protein